ncbi:Phage integrase family protein [compost metagenome]
MTDPADRYLRPVQRDSTQRRYQGVLRYFEQGWGACLPASGDTVVRYLVEHAETLSSSTLGLHLAALAQWHHSHGFDDPTKSAKVRQVLRNIRAQHPRLVKQAEPLSLIALERCVAGLQQQIASDHPVARLRAYRDQALILMGFWRAFRADELCRLRVEHTTLCRGKQLEVFLGSSKTDREYRGQVVLLPALKRLCPVQAYEDWLSISELQEGPVFRPINQWGQISTQGLKPDGVTYVLREAFACSGLDGEAYTGHSLRRGFATWANSDNWTTKQLMDYVGWRDVKSAMRYIDTTAPFGDLRR